MHSNKKHFLGHGHLKQTLIRVKEFKSSFHNALVNLLAESYCILFCLIDFLAIY